MRTSRLAALIEILLRWPFMTADQQKRLTSIAKTLRLQHSRKVRRWVFVEPSCGAAVVIGERRGWGRRGRNHVRLRGCR